MLIQIPNVLTRQQVADSRRCSMPSHWIDGSVTAGHQSRMAKNNMQLAESDAVAIETRRCDPGRASEEIRCLFRLRLPSKIFPPLFNRYAGGQNFGTHVDNAIRQVSGTEHRVRTDLSATLFFPSPMSMRAASLSSKTTMASSV